MKHLIVLFTLTLSLAGCGTLHTMSSKFFSDPGVSSQDKKEVLLETARMKEVYRQYRAYHYFALALLGFGLFIVFSKTMHTGVGLGSIGASVLLSSWATYAPANQGRIGMAMGGLLLSVVVYVVKKLVYDKYFSNRKGVQ